MSATAGTPTVIINNFNVFEAIVPITLAGSYPGTSAGDTLSLIGIVPSNSVPLFVDIQEIPAAGTLASGLVFHFAVGTTQANGALQLFTGAGFTPAGTVSAPTLAVGAGTPATYPVGTAANTGSTTLVATGAVTITGISTPTFTGTAVAAAGLANVGNVTYASLNISGLTARVVYKKFL